MAKLQKLKKLKTRQAIFEYVVAKLLEQGHTSVREDGRECAYRGEGGDMCAIGVLIPDKFYEKRFEDTEVQFVIKEIYTETKMPAFRFSNQEFLKELQGVHDDCYYRATSDKLANYDHKIPWDRKFFDGIKLVAKTFSLSIAFLPKLRKKYHV